MLPEYKTRTNVGVGLGIIFLSIKLLLSKSGHGTPLLFSVLQLAGIICWLVGLYAYAKGKGHHGAWGALGLLSLLGWIVLALMPDKNMQPSSNNPK